MSEAQNMDKMELLFDDLEKPEAIVEAQYSSEATSEENKGQSHFARVGLFFSFDIVNSTMYKTMTGNWPVVIRGLLEDIRARVFKMQDSEGIDGLPKSDVLKFFLEDNCSIVVRPSGTEPKLKAYISVSATTKEEAQVVEGKLARAVEEKM